MLAIAVAMAGVTAYLLWLASRARRPIEAAVVLFLLAMMAEMFGAGLWYESGPSSVRLLEAVWASGVAMAASAVPVFLVALQGALRPGSARPTEVAPPRASRWFLPAVILLVLTAELLMGATLQLASGAGLPGGAGAPGLLTSLTALLVSPWFIASMSLEMGLTYGLLRANGVLPLTVLLPLQAGIMLLTPPAFGTFGTVASYSGSVLMIAVFVFVMEHLYRHRNLAAPVYTYLLALLGVYGLMMVGQFSWYVGWGTSLLALSVLLEMLLFFEAVLDLERFRLGEPRPWQLAPGWTTGVLSLVFVSELFMGALLDVQLQPAQFQGVFFAQPISGAPSVALAAAGSNAFWFVADTTASTWFLVMMGVEMGALVVFKWREKMPRETRVRIGLMVGSYAAFAVVYPSLYFSWLFPGAPPQAQVPVLGWSMGIGSAPLALGVFGAVAATYAITGILSLLFGRRVICSVFCTAPLMYQGTAIDAMRSFNRSSPVARRYLGSRFSDAYKVTTGVTMAALVAASATSFLDQAGRLSVTVGGVDPTIFLFALSFSVLWYATFVTIPYAGTYSCVTMGWCYTGTFAQAFQSIGFFRLRVRDRNVCKACTTLDCAKACPVGLVDMPGHFRTKGEFRSSKCCGVGNCVGACPYGNLYIHDVRHWVRRVLGGTPDPRELPALPVVRASLTPKSSSAALSPLVRVPPRGPPRAG